MAKATGMGRGLAAILSVSDAEPGEERTELRDVAVELIAPNPHQPRKRFDDEALAALASSLMAILLLKAGRLVLHGSVKWNEYDDANLQGVKQVRMFVNGFQQLPVEMKPVPGKPRERRFQVPVVLNSNDNRIEVDLPDLKQDASNRRKFELACEQPIKGAHLHVLVIAPQEKDEAKLVDSLTRVIKAADIKAEN